MSASIYENILYSLLDIYPFLILIHKHYCNEISCDWYNCQAFIKNRCEIKMIETQSDVIEENIFYWKHNSTTKKNYDNFLYGNTMDTK